MFYLYREIAKRCRVDIVCLAHESDVRKTELVADNLWQIKIPKPAFYAKREAQLQGEVGVPITDLASILLISSFSEFIDAVETSVADSDIVVCSHAYLHPLIKSLCNIPIVHESHNVEIDLKRQMLNTSSTSVKLLTTLYEVEKEACFESDLTTVCSTGDKHSYERLFDHRLTKVSIIPNGVDLKTVTYFSGIRRSYLKKKLGMEGAFIALFVGSWHQPNIEAVEQITRFAIQLPKYHFIIVGNVGDFYNCQSAYPNIAFTGFVNDKEKQLFFNIADVALNPMLRGSGTNLKMLDYIAAGIPVLSTPIGARGLDLPSNFAMVDHMENFVDLLSKPLRHGDLQMASDYIRHKFDWRSIGDRYFNALLSLI